MALSPVALFFVLTITGLDRFHMSVFISVMVIVFGAAVAAYAEVHFTWIGIGLVVTAESFEALKSAAFQFLLANKSFSMWEGMYFVSPASLLFLGIAIYTMELQEMIEEDAWGQIKAHPLIFFAGIAIYSDVVSLQTALGYATSIVGFGFYNYAKIKAEEEDDKLAAAEAGSEKG